MMSGYTNEMRPVPSVGILIYDQLCTFEFGIATELFALPRPEFKNWYQCEVIKAEDGPIKALGGITIDANASLSAIEYKDIIIIPGWTSIDTEVPSSLCAALQKAYTNGARIASFCSGVFVLAAAGLLENKTATTHWRFANELAQKYPRIDVNPDVLFIENNRIYSAAGSASGIDLGLHIIRQDFGAKAAASVAKRLILPPQRDGGQKQFIPYPAPSERIGKSISLLQEHVRATINRTWSVENMADFSGISSRTLTRRFHDELGITPLKWLKFERISRAAELLENSNLPLADIWHTCGFGSEEAFRKDFKQQFSIPPIQYRKRFNSTTL